MSETKREQKIRELGEACQRANAKFDNPRRPAEPVIEVALGRQPCREVCGSNEVWTPESGCKCHPPAVPATCEYCGPVCYRGAKHNARVEDGARYTDDPVPAVPAQEAPRCKCGHLKSDHVQVTRFSSLGGCVPFDAKGKKVKCKCMGYDWAVPQAGAQVPSHVICTFDSADNHVIELRDGVGFHGDGKGKFWCDVHEIRRLNAHLNSIKSYATEAAKTPITREDMHDPLKAQTFYDEAKGFERLVMSEINPKGKS